MVMKFYFQNYKKFIFLVLFLGLLLFTFAFLYNKEKETLAQEEFVLDCGEEIPIGEAIDESLVMIKNILDASGAMLAAGGGQIAAVNQIYESGLPDQCRAENCDTGCDRTSELICTPVSECNCITVSACGGVGGSCPPGVENCTIWCVPDLQGGEICAPCWNETTCDTDCPPDCEWVVNCNIRACTGNACPVDLFNETMSQLSQVVSLYPSIAANAAVINQEVGKRDDIIAKLNEARTALEQCATPASGFVPEETLQLLEGLISCEEANWLKILPAESEKCNPDREDYHPKNFLCCVPRVP